MLSTLSSVHLGMLYRHVRAIGKTGVTAQSWIEIERALEAELTASILREE